MRLIALLVRALGVAVLVLLGLPLLPPGHSRAVGAEDYVVKQLKELQRPNAPVQDRREAVENLAKIASQLQHIVGNLSFTLGSDPDEGVRAAAARALGEIGPSAQMRGGTSLVQALQDPSEDVRVAAAGALGGVRFLLDPALDEHAVPGLIRAMKDKSHKVRLIAVQVVSSYTPFAREAVPALVEALKEGDAKQGPGRSVALGAARSLEFLGPDAKAAVPALLELAKKCDNLDLQRQAVADLGAIGDQDERILPVLLAAMENRKLRGAAGFALGGMGPKHAKEVVPVLIKALDVSRIPDKLDGDCIQNCALRALARLGPAAAVAVPRIEAILKSPDTGDQARGAAEDALKKLRR